MRTQCLLISERPEDVEFIKKVAALNELEFHQLLSPTKIKDFLFDFPSTVVFWDVDHKSAGTANHPLSLNLVGAALAGAITPEKVFALSTLPINEVPHLPNIIPFGHYFLRYFTDPACEIFSRIIRAGVTKDPFDLPFYLPENSTIQKVVIKESAQKRVATDALHNVFLKRGVPSRLATIAAQAADELMLNAIFDAPRTTGKIGKTGTFEIAHRSKTERSENFILEPKEAVSLEIGSAPTYLAICVTDQFGSIKKEDVLPFLKRDYSKQGYTTSATGRGPALGINGIVGSGLSLLFLCRPGVKTQAILFLPVIDNFKAFRTSFRFFSFLSK